MKADELAALLPAVFRRALPGDDVLGALLETMEDLHAPVESLLVALDVVFDPRRTPDAMVPLLARWVDLERIDQADAPRTAPARLQDDIPVGRLRELVANAFMLSQLRGTANGLVTFLEIATGAAGFVVEQPGASDSSQAFHLRVHVPAAAADQLRLIERIIASEKPAYTTCEAVTPTAAPSAPTG